MANEEFVIKLNDQTELYLKIYSPVWENCQWAGPDEAITWESLADAEEMAQNIGHGTVGTTKP